MKTWRLLILAALLMVMQLACAVDVAGVKVDEESSLAGQKLVLNGAGIRYKFIIQVYVAALYLPQRSNSFPAILAMPGPKRVAVTMLREISADDLGDAFLSGVRKNLTQDDTRRIGLQLVKLGELFGTIPRLKKGDTFSIDYVPATGTIISVNGKPVTEALPDPLFMDALLKIWMGDYPADSGLKPAMLGIKKENPQANQIRN